MIFFAACSRPLPFPTPAQQNLVALVAPSPLTYAGESTGEVQGLEHDLIEAFAQELGVGVDFRQVRPEDIAGELSVGKAHLAAGWLSRDAADQQMTPPLYITRNLLIQHDASLPVEDISDLDNKTVYALPGSRQWRALQALHGKHPKIRIAETASSDVFQVLQSVDARQINYLLIDSVLMDVNFPYFPNLQITLTLGEEAPIVWWLGQTPNQELARRLGTFIERVQRDGTLARIEDRYLGHVRRLTQADVLKFLGKVQSELPHYRKAFQNAQELTGIDWRLIAAVAYHESNWDPNATSRTGVRGIMMLTEETADKLGVKNRLDPADSILGGARYMAMLRDFLPETAPEPDRTWLSLASYNLGPGHFNAGRTLARQLKADPDSWYEMKRILPLLAQPKYYSQLKTGRARGGEAVILVENIRSYYDILSRHRPAHTPKIKKAKPPVKAGGLGLKPPKG